MNNDLLKFRVWDEAMQHYRDGFYICGDGKLFYLSNSGELIEAQSVDFVVERCTGLRDRNGQLIYEGDILHYHIETTRGDIYENDWEVYWNDEDGSFDFWQCTQEDADIVGNIHDGVKK